MHQLEIGLQLVDVTATLFDPGPLLIPGRQRAQVWISRAVLQFSLYSIGILLRVVALQPSDLLLRAQLGETAGELTRLFSQLEAKEIRLFAGTDGIGCRHTRVGATLRVEDGDCHIDSDIEVVVLKAKVILLVIVELRIATVLNAEGNLWAPDFPFVGVRDVLLGLCICLGRGNGAAARAQRCVQST